MVDWSFFVDEEGLPNTKVFIEIFIGGLVTTFLAIFNSIGGGYYDFMNIGFLIGSFMPGAVVVTAFLYLNRNKKRIENQHKEKNEAEYLPSSTVIVGGSPDIGLGIFILAIAILNPFSTLSTLQFEYLDYIGIVRILSTMPLAVFVGFSFWKRKPYALLLGKIYLLLELVYVVVNQIFWYDTSIISYGILILGLVYLHLSERIEKTYFRSKEQPRGYPLWSILGIIYAFVAPLFGLVFSIIAIKRIKEDRKIKGLELSAAALVISIIVLLIHVSLGVLYMSYADSHSIEIEMMCNDYCWTIQPGSYYEIEYDEMDDTLNCLCYDNSENLLSQNALNISETGVISDPTLLLAEPYIRKIEVDDETLRNVAALMVSDCPSGDQECHTISIFYELLENYEYFGDPRSRELIQTPDQTMELKGGDCEDLSILLNSLLENLGIKTYLVLGEEHAYSLACGLDPEYMNSLVEESSLYYLAELYEEELSKEMGKAYKVKGRVKNGNIVISYESKQSFLLEGGEAMYLSAGDSTETEYSTILDIEYEIEATRPVTIDVLPSEDDWIAWDNGGTYTYNINCEKERVLELKGSCMDIEKYGGLMILNENSIRDNEVDLTLKFSYNIDGEEVLGDAEFDFTTYNVGDQKCIPLDLSLGEGSYPGLDLTEGIKLAIDPVSKDYYEIDSEITQPTNYEDYKIITKEQEPEVITETIVITKIE